MFSGPSTSKGEDYVNSTMQPANFLNDNSLLDKKIYQTLNTNLITIIYSENKKIKSNLYYKKGFFYIYFSLPNNGLNEVYNIEKKKLKEFNNIFMFNNNNKNDAWNIPPFLLTHPFLGNHLHLKNRISYLKIWFRYK